MWIIYLAFKNLGYKCKNHAYASNYFVSDKNSVWMDKQKMLWSDWCLRA